ncbi:hypothetical protein BOTBODRAFT_72487, partial [Botryobasidium botryosum FD-172 SS1]
ITHDILAVSVGPLQLVPVAGIGEAAKLLLSIWDAIENVESNRAACTHLVERCANILISIVDEVGAMGKSVTSALEPPVTKLNETMKMIQDILVKQNSQPFIKRYLSRSEFSHQISDCHVILADSVSLLSV